MKILLLIFLSFNLYANSCIEKIEENVKRQMTEITSEECTLQSTYLGDGMFNVVSEDCKLNYEVAISVGCEIIYSDLNRDDI